MTVNSVEPLLKGTTLDELRRLQSLISTRINELSNVKTPLDHTQYIEHQSGFVPVDLLRRCQEEILTLKFKENCLDTVWVCEVDEQYVFKGYNRKKSVALMKNFPALRELLRLLNESGLTTGDANAILVTRYPDGTTRLNWHSDDESSQISQNSSISIIPLGATRWIQFRKKLRHMAQRRRKKNSIPVLEAYEMVEGDIVIMRPGCQQVLEHRVPPVSVCGGQDGIRFALSARTFLPSEIEALFNEAEDSTTEEPFSPVTPTERNSDSKSVVSVDDEISFDKPSKDVKSESTPTKPVKGQSLPSAVILAGDSFLLGLDEKKLKKRKNLTVYNLARSGLSIAQVKSTLVDFHEKNGSSLQVKKVFLSIGTNDIKRYNVNGVRYLRRPINDLVKLTKELFPVATVFIQSLLPLPVNNRKFIVEDVSEMNRIIYDVCVQLKCNFIDLMFPLLNEHWVRNPSLFKKGGNIHPNSLGYAVIGRIYIRAIHGGRFCPSNW